MKSYLSVDLEYLFDELYPMTEYTNKITVESDSPDDAVNKILAIIKPQIEEAIYPSGEDGLEVDRRGYYVNT